MEVNNLNPIYSEIKYASGSWKKNLIHEVSKFYLSRNQKKWWKKKVFPSTSEMNNNWCVWWNKADLTDGEWIWISQIIILRRKLLYYKILILSYQRYRSKKFYNLYKKKSIIILSITTVGGSFQFSITTAHLQ